MVLHGFDRYVRHQSVLRIRQLGQFVFHDGVSSTIRNEGISGPDFPQRYCALAHALRAVPGRGKCSHSYLLSMTPLKRGGAPTAVADLVIRPHQSDERSTGAVHVT